MEYQVSKEKIAVATNAFSGCKEQPVDIDLTLPDYCPDVQRILKCILKPLISSESINGDALEIDGSAIVTVLYIDSQSGCVRSYEHTMPFRTVMALKNISGECVSLTSTKVEYINCRALTPRRLDLHGAFSVCAKISCTGEKELTSSIDSEDVETKTEEVCFSALSASSQTSVSISEVTALPQGKNSIQGFLKRDARCFLDDVKLLPDKAIVKGEVSVKLLYISDIESGEIDLFEYSLPFEKVVELVGCDEDSIYKARCEICSYNISYDETEHSVSSDIKLMLTLCAYKNKKVSCVKDAYSTEYEMQSTSMQGIIPGECVRIDETGIIKESIEINDKPLKNIIDLWAVNPTLSGEHKDGRYILTGKLPISFLAKTVDDEVIYAEKSLNVELPIDASLLAGISNDAISPDICAILQNLSYRLNGDSTLEIKCEIKASGVLIGEQTVEYISKAEYNEEAKIKRNSSKLVLYYADKGESIWSIGKKYKASISGIYAENDGLQEVAPGGLIMLSI